MDASGPVRIILAQVVYATSPIFQSGDGSTLKDFADTLDDHQRAREFAAFLREEQTGDES